AGCRRPGSASWRAPPNAPGSARGSWPRGTATRWPRAIRWRPRPGGDPAAPPERTRRRGRPCRRPRPRDRPARPPEGPSTRGAGGRFIRGLGVGNEVMNSRFGLPSRPPLEMIEEYVHVIRSVLNGGTGYDGQLFRTGMVPLDSPPARAGLPVYLGALGPRMVA